MDVPGAFDGVTPQGWEVGSALAHRPLFGGAGLAGHMTQGRVNLVWPLPMVTQTVRELLAGQVVLPHQSIVDALQSMTQAVAAPPPVQQHYPQILATQGPFHPALPAHAPPQPVTPVAMRCTYAHCNKPNVSNRFYKIEAGRTSGGQDWSPLVGHTLCTACYCRYERGGTLERSVNKPIPNSARRCSHPGCDRPNQSSQFYLIEAGRKSGGQDWSKLAGWVLCKSCYTRYEQRGTLERSVNKPLPPSQRRCSYPYCDRPDHGRAFFQIEANRTSGGQDWSPLVGWVLCQPCYKRYKDRGTLERSQNKPLDASARRCTYEGCDRQGTGGDFFQIEEGKTAGGQDWSPITGCVLCQSCYERYKHSGSLKRTRTKPLPPNLRRCTYEGCLRDWSALAGSVLCKSCYSRYERGGTLERQKPRKSAAKATRKDSSSSCSSPIGAVGGAFAAVGQKRTRGEGKGNGEKGGVGGDVFASLVQLACAERDKVMATAGSSASDEDDDGGGAGEEEEEEEEEGGGGGETLEEVEAEQPQKWDSRQSKVPRADAPQASPKK